MLQPTNAHRYSSFFTEFINGSFFLKNKCQPYCSSSSISTYKDELIQAKQYSDRLSIITLSQTYSFTPYPTKSKVGQSFWIFHSTKIRVFRFCECFGRAVTAIDTTICHLSDTVSRPTLLQF